MDGEEECGPEGSGRLPGIAALRDEDGGQPSDGPRRERQAGDTDDMRPWRPRAQRSRDQAPVQGTDRPPEEGVRNRLDAPPPVSRGVEVSYAHQVFEVIRQERNTDGGNPQERAGQSAVERAKRGTGAPHEVRTK